MKVGLLLAAVCVLILSTKTTIAAEYLVEEDGQDFSSIAEKLGQSVENVAWLNGKKKTDKLMPGDVVRYIKDGDPTKAENFLRKQASRDLISEQARSYYRQKADALKNFGFCYDFDCGPGISAYIVWGTARTADHQAARSLKESSPDQIPNFSNKQRFVMGQ